MFPCNKTSSRVSFVSSHIKNVMENTQIAFQYKEDERLSRAIVNLADNKHLSLDELIARFEQANIDFESYIIGIRKRVNWKHLFRSCISQLSKRKLLTHLKDKSVLTVSNNIFDNPYL